MADYFLTRRAALDLQDIYVHSKEQWGKSVADDYIRASIKYLNRLQKSRSLENEDSADPILFTWFPLKNILQFTRSFPRGSLL